MCFSTYAESETVFLCVDACMVRACMLARKQVKLVVWCMPVILAAFRRVRQEGHHKFQASLNMYH